MSDLEPADWEVASGFTPEEQAQIDALHAALNAPAHIDALTTRIEALQVQIDDAKAELARVEDEAAALPAEIVTEANAESEPVEPEVVDTPVVETPVDVPPVDVPPVDAPVDPVPDPTPDPTPEPAPEAPVEPVEEKPVDPAPKTPADDTPAEPAATDATDPAPEVTQP